MAEAEQAGVDDLETHLTDVDEKVVVERLRRNSTFLAESIAVAPKEGREPRLAAYTRRRKESRRSPLFSRRSTRTRRHSRWRVRAAG